MVRNQSQKSCKTSAEITTDIKQLLSYGWTTIRIYNTVDCNAINVVLNTITGTGAKVIIGINNLQSQNSDTASLVSQVNGRWNLVQYITVINGSSTNSNQIKQAISYVRSKVPKGTLLTTVADYQQYQKTSALCNVGQDFIAASVEPWNHNIAISQLGSFVTQAQQSVASTCKVSSVSIVGSTRFVLF